MKTVLFVSFRVLLAVLASIVLFGAPAFSAETAEEGQSFWHRNAKASYLGELLGPHTTALNGNKDGQGRNLTLNHYFAAGAKFSEDLSLSLTQMGAQKFDEKTEAQSRHWAWTDPYLTLNHGKLYANERYGWNVDGYLRYYVPVSRPTRDAENTGYLNAEGPPHDRGHGELRLYVNPAKTFLDGKLTVNATALTNVPFHRLSAEERFARQRAELQRTGGDVATAKSFREDIYFQFDPTVAYSVHPKLDLYVEYSPGVWRHSTDGTWTSSNHPWDGQYVSPGVYWNPTKTISVNPYLSWGPVFQGLTKADVALQVQYTFL